MNTEEVIGNNLFMEYPRPHKERVEIKSTHCRLEVEDN